MKSFRPAKVFSVASFSRCQNEPQVEYQYRDRSFLGRICKAKQKTDCYNTQQIQV